MADTSQPTGSFTKPPLFLWNRGGLVNALGVNLLSCVGAVIVVKGVGHVPRSSVLMFQLNFILLLLSTRSILILIYLPLQCSVE